MAEERLRYKVTADTKQFVQGMQQVQRVSAQTNRNIRKQGQAFTQLAYALDDAQYGFRGVQNNIQALAVQMGASGPWVLAITAATVAIGYFINKLGESGREAKKAAKELKDYQDQVKSIEKAQNNVLGQFNDPGVEQWRKRFEGLGNDYDKIGFLLGDLEQKTYEYTRAVTRDNDTLERRRKLGIKTSKEEGEQFRKRANQLRELKALLAIVSTKYDQLYKAANPPAKKTKKTSGGGPTPILDEELAEAMENLEFAEFENKLIGISDAAHEAAGGFQAMMENAVNASLGIDPMKDKIKQLQDALNDFQAQGFVAGGIFDFASRFGEQLAQGAPLIAAAGDALISALSNFITLMGTEMVKLGVIAVVGGKAIAAIKKWIVANPALAIAGGLALIAIGAFVGSKANQAGSNIAGKSGGAGGAATGTPSAAAGPQFTAGTLTGRSAGQLVTRGEEIRYISQVAGDNYQAYS